uniref:Uncharacterized protein n=1 Tax=Parascaris univalens TaxID=6257 RepID=A0A915AH79_PARUN
ATKMKFYYVCTCLLLTAISVHTIPSWYFTNDENLLLGKKSFAMLPPRGATMISGRGFAPGFFERPSLQFYVNKRAVRKGSLAPRGATMVSGRGFGPGFFDSHNFFVRKRSAIEPVDELLVASDLLRPS